jgi:hypothetical protein
MQVMSTCEYSVDSHIKLGNHRSYKVEDYNLALFRRTMIPQLYKVEDYNPALLRRTMITQLYQVEDYNPALFRRTMITQLYKVEDYNPAYESISGNECAVKQYYCSIIYITTKQKYTPSEVFQYRVRKS